MNTTAAPISRDPQWIRDIVPPSFSATLEDELEVTQPQPAKNDQRDDDADDDQPDEEGYVCGSADAGQWGSSRCACCPTFTLR